VPVSYRTPGVYFEWQDSVPPQIDIPRTDIAGFVGIAARGPLHQAVKIESWTQFANVFGAHIAQGFLAYSVEGFFLNGGRTCWVVRVTNPAKAVAATLEPELNDSTGPIRVRATSPGTWANQARVRPVIRKGLIDSLSILLTSGEEVIVPRTEFLKAKPARAADVSDNRLAVVNDALEPDFQKLIEVRLGKDKPGVAVASDGYLTGGWDGLELLQAEHYFDEDCKFGLAALKDVGEISIVAIPDLMPKLRLTRAGVPPPLDCSILLPNETPPVNLEEPVFAPNLGSDDINRLQSKTLADCYLHQYRVAILDTPSNVITPDDAIKYLDEFPRSDATSSFATAYYPWILVTDPLRLGGLTRAIPPSGHLAGVYARIDRTRGVHKPPANVVLEGASDTLFEIDDISHGELNSGNVNAIRDSAGRGIRVMGARTLHTGLLLRYVNVRRLLLMIERALEAQLQWTVHEPNDERLWTNIDRVVRASLESLFHLGMLDGATSAEAYSVRCDGKTNQDVTEQGKAICVVGVRPPYPAEFVVLRIGITRNGIQVEERESQDV